MVNNTEKRASAGRVLIVSKGDWDAGTTYEMLDLVNHNGYAFLAKKTVVGIEPTDEHSEYWHNMLAIKDIVENAIAETVADSVGDILEDRFRDMLSEAKYSSNLLDELTEATFVQWDANTENTPYTDGVTENEEGFALAYGTASSFTVIAWTVGHKKPDCYVRYITEDIVSEWESYLADCLTTSGGTITGPLGLGGGKGTVSADDKGAFLESSADSENYRRIIVDNPSTNAPISDAAKLVSSSDGNEKIYTLFGKHNLPYAAQIVYGTYVGRGTSGASNPNVITVGFEPKFLMIYTASPAIPFAYGSTIIAAKGMSALKSLRVSGVNSHSINDWLAFAWGNNSVSWYQNNSEKTGEEAANGQRNALGTTYHYIVIG